MNTIEEAIKQTASSNSFEDINNHSRSASQDLHRYTCHPGNGVQSSSVLSKHNLRLTSIQSVHQAHSTASSNCFHNMNLRLLLQTLIYLFSCLLWGGNILRSPVIWWMCNSLPYFSFISTTGCRTSDEKTHDWLHLVRWHNSFRERSKNGYKKQDLKTLCDFNVFWNVFSKYSYTSNICLWVCLLCIF